ncbi:MAG: DNA polymerase III subunit gamma/tau, partial [Alphaproteobacteria bacterium]
VAATPEALALVARAADGSVRDGLSILDQAIAHSGGAVEEAALRDMLGLADRAQVFDLFEALMAGEAGRALDELARQYGAGVDPVVVLQDLLELSHWLTRVKVVPDATEGVAVAETERRRGADLAQRLPMAVLARTWQMLLKGLGEARFAPNPLAAAEMVLVRLAYVADLPAPADVIKAAQSDGVEPVSRVPVTPAPTPVPVAPTDNGGGGATQAALAPVSEPTPQPEPEPEPEQPSRPENFEAVVDLVETMGEMLLLSSLRACVRLVDFKPGRIEFRPTGGAPDGLANDLGAKLGRWTGERWIVVVSGEEGAPTLDEQDAADHARRIAEAGDHPLVAAVLETFTDAKVTDVRDRPARATPNSDGDERP